MINLPTFVKRFPLRGNLFFLFAGVMAIVSALIFDSCKPDSEPEPAPGIIQLVGVNIGLLPIDLSNSSKNTELPVDHSIQISFSTAIDSATAVSSIRLYTGSDTASVAIGLADGRKKVTLVPGAALLNNKDYVILIKKTLRGKAKETFAGFSVSFKTIPATLRLDQFLIDGVDALTSNNIRTINRVFSSMDVFSTEVDISNLGGAPLTMVSPEGNVPLVFTWENDKTLLITASTTLTGLLRHRIVFNSSLKGINGEPFNQPAEVFYTELDPKPKMPLLTDDELLTKVQEQTFRYFYDFAEPNSGLARERNSSGNLVTSGGSGFGIMALIVGMERGFITRDQGISHMKKMVTFLENADRFHGAWSHWIDGTTGKVIPFSTKDNGGDLVETSFLVQGLITFRQYLDQSIAEEKQLADRITLLWEGVEWDWYRRDNQNVLYWHWSPQYNWDMNFAMYGYFEQQITYFLAAASPTHSIPKEVYTNGFGRNGNIKTGQSYYNIVLPLGTPSPLFWVHYSYLGLDPHFSDDYANYWDQNVNASLINHAYCASNPRNYVGYSDSCWGLTSSDNQNGYDAHSPSNDLGVITPTAALSSFPYSPEESMKALKFFYYTLGDRLWGPYGFYDAFNITEGWTADSYLAIDQGPIVVMIENYRTGLLWNLFMSAPEVQAGMTKLGYLKN